MQNRNWRIVREDDRVSELIPPGNFGLPEDYKVIVPKTNDRVDFDKYYNNLLQVFGDFYLLGKDDLNLILEKEDTILKIRIYDDTTSKGKIGFLRFEGIIESLKAILTDTASFVIDKNITSNRVPAEAHRYMNKCHFLQTEKGSYVAKIQLPSKELIKDKELFDRAAVYASEVNDKLNEVLEYVNTQIFTNNVSHIDDNYLIENFDKLNLKLFKDIESLYQKADIKNVDFSFHNMLESKTIESQDVTKEKVHRLTQFIEGLANQAVETKEVTVRGVITALKSKDPDGGKNSITLTGINEDLPVIASANLSSDQYKEAIEAHKIKEYVQVGGLARTTKTSIRFIRVDRFVVG